MSLRQTAANLIAQRKLHVPDKLPTVQVTSLESYFCSTFSLIIGVDHIPTAFLFVLTHASHCPQRHIYTASHFPMQNTLGGCGSLSPACLTHVGKPKWAELLAFLLQTARHSISHGKAFQERGCSNPIVCRATPGPSHITLQPLVFFCTQGSFLKTPAPSTQKEREEVFLLNLKANSRKIKQEKTTTLAAVPPVQATRRFASRRHHFVMLKSKKFSSCQVQVVGRFKWHCLPAAPLLGGAAPCTHAWTHPVLVLVLHNSNPVLNSSLAL